MRSAIFNTSGNKAGRNVITIGLLILSAILFSSCLRPKLKISQEAPPIFYMPNNKKITSFHIGVVNESGPIWLLYPKDGNLTLGEFSSIKYGEAPPSCQQVTPSDAVAPPPLIEGEIYYAVAGISDDDNAQIRFIIKGGKIIELHKE